MGEHTLQVAAAHECALANRLCNRIDGDSLVSIIELSILIRSKILSPSRESNPDCLHEVHVAIVLGQILVSCLCHTITFQFTLQRYKKRYKENPFITQIRNIFFTHVNYGLNFTSGLNALIIGPYFFISLLFMYLALLERRVVVPSFSTR